MFVFSAHRDHHVQLLLHCHHVCWGAPRWHLDHYHFMMLLSWLVCLTRHWWTQEANRLGSVYVLGEEFNDILTAVKCTVCGIHCNCAHELLKDTPTFWAWCSIPSMRVSLLDALLSMNTKTWKEISVRSDQESDCILVSWCHTLQVCPTQLQPYSCQSVLWPVHENQWQVPLPNQFELKSQFYNNRRAYWGHHLY